IKELEDGSIVIANEMTRYIDDTLRQPFIPDIILPAPLYYFHIFKIDPSGKFLWQYSYQCPPTKNTSVKGDFVPQIKNVTKLPNGNFSICADMYIPTDNEVYYYHTIFSKRAVNLIVSDHGFFLKLISYSIQGKGACSLENAVETGNNSEQLLLAKDSTNEQSILFKIDSEGKIVWSKAYANPVNGSNAASTFLEKQNNKGYFIFHSDPASLDFHLSVTNAVGNDPCTQLPATMVSEEIAWPWFVNKIHYDKVDLIVDYGYSPFSIAKKVHPLSQTINCQYQYECCKDFIDSLRPHNINLCEGQFYTLPDKTIVKDSGTYYVTLKTQAGCDSIIFYNVKILKLPAHLTTSQDTCLNNEASILLTAAEGYESYLWNNVSTTVNPFYPVSFPGSYTVKVQNICGSKTDTIQVYDQCDFPIYFPGAFTPNGDLLNDILRVPALNKNRLIRLSIYNRWGKLIYHTTNPEAGWDGNLAGIPQQGGTYIYFL
ncbi:MAG TPA: gliding motility-associated C-terminal domain-containing protein, partial [Panacibacter sp.]|nr:gliding motility-associated C-terminal domain-containing protein [Panacibacter sp.]